MYATEPEVWEEHYTEPFQGYADAIEETAAHIEQYGDELCHDDECDVCDEQREIAVRERVLRDIRGESQVLWYQYKNVLIPIRID